jgi:mono/diheme cytochrome c family protein
MRFVGLVFMALAMCLGVQAQAPVSSNPGGASPAGDAEEGRRTWVDSGCYQCHGFEGQGGAGARLAQRGLTFAGFSRYVRQPGGVMPPYTSQVLSNQQMEDIFAFVMSIPEPPSVSSIPLLQDD